jgi:hypothetical protein
MLASCSSSASKLPYEYFVIVHGLMAATRHRICLQVEGRWRLVDVAYGAAASGHLAFYTPPEAMIRSHMPLEAYWQLLDAPLSHHQFWEQPAASPALFSAGLELCTPSLRAVHHLQAARCASPRVPRAFLVPAFQAGSFARVPVHAVLKMMWQAAADVASQHLCCVSGSSCAVIGCRTEACLERQPCNDLLSAGV